MQADERLPAIRVLIADDHAVVREGLRSVLETDAGFVVLGEAADGAAAVAMAQQHRPDVVVLDLSMPVLSGLEALAQIRAQVPDARVLVLSMHDHEEYVLQSVRAGALGYLRKDSSPAQVRAAIRAIAAGGSYFSEPVARTLSEALSRGEGKSSGVDALTPRERDVLVEIASGATNKDIAGRLHISIRTVESHRESLMRKLNLRGVASLTRFAIDAGLIRTTTEP